MEKFNNSKWAVWIFTPASLYVTHQDFRQHLIWQQSLIHQFMHLAKIRSTEDLWVFTAEMSSLFWTPACTPVSTLNQCRAIGPGQRMVAIYKLRVLHPDLFLFICVMSTAEERALSMCLLKWWTVLALWTQSSSLISFPPCQLFDTC